jgi:hypothetical protein
MERLESLFTPDCRLTFIMRSTTNADAYMVITADELEKVIDVLEREMHLRAPYVCPGCYAVGGEPCAPGCIDAAREAAREEPDGDENDEW